MSAIRLLVLGDVRLRGRAHGYQVRGDLEYWGAHEWSSAKPGSIYHALKQLAKQDLLRAHDIAPSTAGGPPRTEYEITAAGETEFFRMLRYALTATREKQELLTSAIGFLVDLARGEAIDLLTQRVAALESWRDEVTASWSPAGAVAEEQGHIGEIMKLWVRTADSDAAWARELIGRLERGAFVMAGEGARDLSVLSDRPA
ncbi:PadR family transcriptional regulator [Streptomyces tubbatahanensis]|uniref:PadR family transcriptional regulator n=1 Tax=Streptomyces tubbatahanensis TaxID=2923272 RepID=A0ABY3XUQ1_9ACTN|nr:PadR family transcriptional regulator [Streptomyces tubbatahanensis]UNS98218.1 PadR family transcriptional regulator [Streptomyces tubbatahanensis]